jgi:adenosine deaminase
MDRAMLADLHRHLDGSMRRATLADLLGRAPPADLQFEPAMGLGAALSRFAITLSALQRPEAVRRVAAEMCEDAAADGVGVLEIRFAPQLHLEAGATVEQVVDAAVEGAAGRAGIILCGLYGEAPDVLERLVAVGRARAGVVGIDLAGGPASGDRWRLEDYAAPFRRAADAGLGRTVHAGEGRPPAEIRTAIVELLAQRIGHGTTLLDDPAVVELVVARGVTIEACPTSNVHTGVIAAVAEHPLPRWLDAGVRATVCTDNTLLSDVTLSEELRRVAAIPGMDAARLEQLGAHGRAAAFFRKIG